MPGLLTHPVILMQLHQFFQPHFLLIDKIREKDREDKIVEYKETGSWPGTVRPRRLDPFYIIS